MQPGFCGRFSCPALPVLFAVGASVPGISYRSVTIASQTQRVRQFASELGALSEDGTLLQLHVVDDKGVLAENLKDALNVINKLDVGCHWMMCCIHFLENQMVTSSGFNPVISQIS